MLKIALLLCLSTGLDSFVTNWQHLRATMLQSLTLPIAMAPEFAYLLNSAQKDQ